MDRTEIIAALGPTNTGKTHRAIQTMLEYASGMIGLPLRLLAREVYDRVCTQIGASRVALVTGEEKRVPPRPDYWVCTVEAMPMDRSVDFLAVDEIQLASHPERGHIFTDRLLHARGRRATWFMGSETMKSLIEQLVPVAEFRRFPRLSSLRAEQSFTLGNLPRRSAVVAFSANKVYEAAEKLRARKGGAAVVLGALSPRARNAQVEMYQAGEVEFLVATDAIGMGLNLDIDRVAFAETRKFDGHQLRDLELSELAQIAGRAGRHQKDGSFGTYDRQPLPFSVQRAIESHRFPSISHLVWRNAQLDFSRPQALLNSLLLSPPHPRLRLVQQAEDTETLKKVLNERQVQERLNGERELQLLWDVCQIPDYRRLLVDEHSRLAAEIFLELHQNGEIAPSFILPRLARLRRHSGDIESIMDRIKAVRTWTFVAHQGTWVDKRHGLATKAAQIEDELSDDLNHALVDRFVQKKKRIVAELSSFRQTNAGAPAAAKGGDFRFQLMALRDQWAAPPKVSTQSRLLEASSDDLRLSPQGRLFLKEEEVALLRPGPSLLRPRVQPRVELSGHERKHLEALVHQLSEQCLGHFLATIRPPDHASERALVYQLRAHLGATPRSDIDPFLAELSPRTSKKWSSQGLVIGRASVFLKHQLRAPSIRARLALLHVFYSSPQSPKIDFRGAESLFERPEQAGRPSLAAGEIPKEIWLKLGYWVLARRAIRLDVLESVLDRAQNEPEARLVELVATHCGIKSRAAQQVARAIAQGRLLPKRRTP